MIEKSQSAHVYCESKNRDVEVKFVESGPWYKRHRKLITCPARTDAGETCNCACLKPKPTPWGNKQLSRNITFYL